MEAYIEKLQELKKVNFEEYVKQIENEVETARTFDTFIPPKYRAIKIEITILLVQNLQYLKFMEDNKEDNYLKEIELNRKRIEYFLDTIELLAKETLKT